MASNTLFFAWNRPIPGRERLSQAHFTDMNGYLTGLRNEGAIDGYETVLLDVHGGDLNGFFLIRGEPGKLDALQGSEAWQHHMTRATLHLLGAGAVRGVSGAAIGERMARWASLLPD
ncbi:MAG: hypothetical protein KDG55_06485 [Rhodocyclaceae bacterium]|nr:hypothetical protein [Rhodocyclaceae bacterium]